MAAIEAPDVPVARLSSTGRVEAFSDGVMAIAITLLVLDLKVPTPDQVDAAHGLIQALAERWTSYLAYLTAFLTIGIVWLNHRAFIDKVRGFDGKMLWLNILLLLGIATLPFPTAILAEYVGVGGAVASAAAVVYGSLSVVTAAPWVLMWLHLTRHPELLEPEYGVAYARKERKRALIGPVIYLLAIPIAAVAPLVALFFYIGIGVLYAVTNQGVDVSRVKS